MAPIQAVWKLARNARVRDSYSMGRNAGSQMAPLRILRSCGPNWTATFVASLWKPLQRDFSLPKTSGLKSPLMCLNQARFGIAWGAVGAAMACYEWAVDYTKQRTQFGKPIASFQLVQEKLAGMLTEITKGQLLAWRLGRLKDEGKLHFAQVSLAKRNNVRIALETARLARDLMGASGITLEYPVFRHMCNLESVYTYEGTDHIHTLILGEHITGIPAYS